MRTGSNFLESNLNAIPGVTCHGEAFNPYFIGGENKQQMFGIDLAGRQADPAGFLQAMQTQTEGLAGFRYFHDHDPRVFDLVVEDPQVAKVILTRNALECYISWKIAIESDQWWLANTKHLRTVRPRFDLAEFETRLGVLQTFQQRLLHRLQVTGQTAYYIDYADILDLDVLNGLAAFLGASGRLKDLDFRFKKQNPEALRDKVANPDEMEAALAQMDWFSIAQTPNFEPRRSAAVPQYLASQSAPLLFQPVKGGPDTQIRQWLSGFGPLAQNFDRKSLKAWKDGHHGFRAFTVLRHPLPRAYAAWCEYADQEFMPELRPYLKRVHKFAMPPRSKPFDSAEQFRAGFLVFLDFARHLLAGRTELRVTPQLASQTAVLQGFAAIQSPDLILREDRLADGLAYLCLDLGIDAPPLPDMPDPAIPLDSIWGEDLELAAEAAYGRDYQAYGFRRWKTP